MYNNVESIEKVFSVLEKFESYKTGNNDRKTMWVINECEVYVGYIRKEKGNEDFILILGDPEYGHHIRLHYTRILNEVESVLVQTNMKLSSKVKANNNAMDALLGFHMN